MVDSGICLLHSAQKDASLSSIGMFVGAGSLLGDDDVEDTMDL